MVAGGAGVTLLPSLAVPIETRRAKLSVRRFVNPPGRTLALVSRRSCPLVPALKRVAELARESYRKIVVQPAPRA